MIINNLKMNDNVNHVNAHLSSDVTIRVVTVIPRPRVGGILHWTAVNHTRHIIRSTRTFLPFYLLCDQAVCCLTSYDE